jgi:hypothetical protein
MSVAVIKRPHEQLQKLQQTFLYNNNNSCPARPCFALPFVACVSFCLQSVSRSRSEAKQCRGYMMIISFLSGGEEMCGNCSSWS